MENRVFYGVRIPSELSKQIEASGKGKTEVITAALECYFGKPTIEREPEAPKLKAIPKTVEVGKKTEREEKPAALKPCNRCDGPTVLWGASWRRCLRCCQNWPLAP
jgi:hypothetical protein